MATDATNQCPIVGCYVGGPHSHESTTGAPPIAAQAAPARGLSEEQRERELAELRRTLPTPDSIAAELTRDKTELEAKVAEQAEELSEIAAAIGSVRFMDPPDGGSVTLAEQVTRMREALANAEARGRDE